MAMNIKNDAVERLAAEVARLAGESKTEAIRKALEERRRRLRSAPGAERREAVLAFLKKRVWPQVPKGEIGRALTKAEEDAILGYGPEGV
jgi:antitoxin VapB